MLEGRRSSAPLVLLALVLAAGILSAVAQLHPPAGTRYMLVTLKTGPKLAMRIGDNALRGFANGKNQWFAVTGSEDLVPPGSNIPSQGLVNMLGALVIKANGTH
jgi:hypothetical protein